MKIRFSLFLAFVVCVLFSMFYGASTAQDVKQRSIGRLPIDRNEPLRIGAVKIQGRQLRRNQKFDADGDWLKDLSVTIKNLSGKRILFASIDLFFRPPTGSEGPPAVDELDYGNRMLLIRSPDRREQLVGIEPEQTVEMQLSAVAHDRIKSLLADVGYVEVRRLDLRIGTVIFSDDSNWYVGGNFRRNPSDPTSWIEVLPQEGSALSNSSKAGVDTVLATTRFRDDVDRVHTASSSDKWNSSLRLATSPRRMFISPALYLPRAQSGCYDLVRNTKTCFIGAQCTTRLDTTTMNGLVPVFELLTSL